jgi:hypothetical protein
MPSCCVPRSASSRDKFLPLIPASMIRLRQRHFFFFVLPRNVFFTPSGPFSDVPFLNHLSSFPSRLRRSAVALRPARSSRCWHLARTGTRRAVGKRACPIWTREEAIAESGKNAARSSGRACNDLCSAGEPVWSKVETAARAAGYPPSRHSLIGRLLARNGGQPVRHPVAG